MNFPNIYKYCENVEEFIKKQEYEQALSESRKAIESTINTIYIKENEKYPKKLGIAISNLGWKKILKPPIVRQYNEIRDVGNYLSIDLI